MAYKHIRIPTSGEKITVKDGKLCVPEQPIVGFVEGDGIAHIGRRPEQRLDDDLLAEHGDEQRQVAVFTHGHVQAGVGALDQLDGRATFLEQLRCGQRIEQTLCSPNLRHGTSLLLHRGPPHLGLAQFPLECRERLRMLGQYPHLFLDQPLLAQALTKETLVVGR